MKTAASISLLIKDKLVLTLLILLMVSCSHKNGDLVAQQHSENKTMKTRPLTPEERYVIVNKGTEAPFTGKYVNSHADGTYLCRQCGAQLFLSSQKFDSHCGWPSFDDAIAGAVKRIPDADGQRTEIVCAACGGHLGHVFEGEGFTEKDMRHCVNSLSLDFAPRASAYDTVYFASGCFWGTEYMFQGQPGVVSTRAGYIGGTKTLPTYQEVCTGRTGHAEAIQLVYDKTKTDFRRLAMRFFETHDPTQLDRQGPDIGTQYRTAIFYTITEQKTVADELIDKLLHKGYSVVTEITPAGTFWEAEAYHQQYYQHKGTQPYCHIYRKRF